MSVIFSAALTGVGHIARAAVSLAERIPHASVEFELSQDGETIWGDYSEYSFVGFSENGDFSTSVGLCPVAVGKKLGKLKYEADSVVRKLCTSDGDYIMVTNDVDAAEVFKRVC